MRWIIRILVALVAVVGIAVAILFMLPTEKIGQLASDQLERATGRTLKLTGEFSPTLFPILGVKTGPIEITNADWASNGVMIEAKGVVVGVKLSALLSGALEIQKLKLIEPVIWLERAADGRVNWALDPGETSQNAEGGQAAGGTDFSLALGEISDGRVIFEDNQAAVTVEVSNINAKISIPKDSAAARLSGSAVWQGKSLSLSADIADWKALADGAVSAVDLNATGAGATAGLAGLVGLGTSGLPTVDGTVKLTLQDLTQTLAGLGAEPLAAPLDNLRDIATEGQLQLSDAGLFLRGTASLNLNGLPFTSKLELTGAGNWLENLDVSVVADVAIKDALEARFNGDVQGASATLDGQLDIKASDPRRLAAGFGARLDMPKGTFGSAAVSGALRIGASGEAVLENARLAVDKNLLVGRVSLKGGDKPLVTANLSSKALDLSAFLAEQDTSGGSQNSTTTGWSKAPIGLSGLDAVDADIKLRAGSVNLGVSQLGVTDISARLRNGQLRLNLVDVRAFDGVMSGTVTVSGGRSLSFSSDVLAKSMRLKPLLGQLLGVDRLIGTGTVKLDLAGSGVSIYDVMNALTGSGNIKFENGSIRGIDLAAMMQNLKSAFGGFEGATDFTSMTGSFHMTKGVLDNVDLSLISPLFKALGQGQVNIGGRSMNYTVTPSTLSGDAEISVPVIISGPWNNLKFRPDLEKLINILLQGKLGEQAAVKKAKKAADRIKEQLKNPETTLKKKLKAKVAKKLQPETGGTAETETVPLSVEDQLKQKAKDEIGNALKNLFK